MRTLPLWWCYWSGEFLQIGAKPDACHECHYEDCLRVSDIPYVAVGVDVMDPKFVRAMKDFWDTWPHKLSYGYRGE